MKLSSRTRLIVLFVVANVVILTVGSMLILNRPLRLPQIEGVFLPTAKSLPSFELTDQHGQSFSNKNLVGRWHIVSYGFTSCPDICPTLLADLNVVATTLPKEERPRFVFYSVDHRRDTPLQLASYLDFFNPDFIGLTRLNDEGDDYRAFEEGLGIVAQLGDGSEEVGSDYQVSHGVNLFLLNPAGKLQAVFRPGDDSPRGPAFDPATLMRDYRAVRRYHEDRQG